MFINVAKDKMSFQIENGDIFVILTRKHLLRCSLEASQ